jgi:signal transduction histidine kinase
MADQPGADMKHIGAIRSSLTRVINLANDLLMIEQMESMHLPLKSEVENMQELVDHACSTLCALSSAADVRLVNELGPEYVIVDRKRILQVLVNYLSNAIKFSPAQSSISISSLKSEGMLKVLVRDNGPGIPQEEQAKLFERFYQTKAGRAAGGTGLGLTSAKMIVEAHNGTVGVMSEQGKGALFWFTVPLPNE